MFETLDEVEGVRLQLELRHLGEQAVQAPLCRRAGLAAPAPRRRQALCASDEVEGVRLQLELRHLGEQAVQAPLCRRAGLAAPAPRRRQALCARRCAAAPASPRPPHAGARRCVRQCTYVGSSDEVEGVRLQLELRHLGEQAVQAPLCRRAGLAAPAPRRRQALCARRCAAAPASPRPPHAGARRCVRQCTYVGSSDEVEGVRLQLELRHLGEQAVQAPLCRRAGLAAPAPRRRQALCARRCAAAPASPRPPHAGARRCVRQCTYVGSSDEVEGVRLQLELRHLGEQAVQAPLCRRAGLAAPAPRRRQALCARRCAAAPASPRPPHAGARRCVRQCTYVGSSDEVEGVRLQLELRHLGEQAVQAPLCRRAGLAAPAPRRRQALCARRCAAAPASPRPPHAGARRCVRQCTYVGSSDEVEGVRLQLELRHLGEQAVQAPLCRRAGLAAPAPRRRQALCARRCAAAPASPRPPHAGARRCVRQCTYVGSSDEVEGVRLQLELRHLGEQAVQAPLCRRAGLAAPAPRRRQRAARRQALRHVPRHLGTVPKCWQWRKNRSF
uniref:Uncharacterized protein n=1 Tax=Heliothis virescens TaxID=7102 RepID=A0A2A4K7G7_HELVI